MQSLIKKAIEAIEAQKYERAVGLLEGALEMSGENEADEMKLHRFVSDEPKNIPAINNYPLTYAGGDTLENAQQNAYLGIGNKSGPILDPSSISDAEVKARLANIQKPEIQ